MDLKTYQRDCLLGTLGAVLMLIGDLCLSIRRQRTICQRGISEWIVGRMAAAAAAGHRAFRYGAGLFYRKGFLRADTSAVPKDPDGAPHRRRDLHSLRRGGAFFHRQSCGLDGEACADTWPRRNGCRDTGPVPATDAAAAYRLRGNDLAYPYELFCPADEENRLAAANACVAYVGLADRVCADPGYADFFRRNAAHRGHAACDAEDRQLLSADTGSYHDEKCLSRRQHGKYPAACLCDAGTDGTLHRSRYPFFPLGVALRT